MKLAMCDNFLEFFYFLGHNVDDVEVLAVVLQIPNVDGHVITR